MFLRRLRRRRPQQDVLSEGCSFLFLRNFFFLSLLKTLIPRRLSSLNKSLQGGGALSRWVELLLRFGPSNRRRRRRRN